MRPTITTYNWVTETAATLSPAVAKKGAQVEGQKGDPDRGPGHQVVKAELAWIRNYWV